MYMLGYNNDGVLGLPSTQQVSVGFAGGGMTQTNVNNFTDTLEVYMDAIGAGIIP